MCSAFIHWSFCASNGAADCLMRARSNSATSHRVRAPRGRHPVTSRAAPGSSRPHWRGGLVRNSSTVVAPWRFWLAPRVEHHQVRVDRLALDAEGSTQRERGGSSRWSSPRSTCVMSISTSSIALARKNTGVPFERTITKSTRSTSRPTPRRARRRRTCWALVRSSKPDGLRLPRPHLISCGRGEIAAPAVVARRDRPRGVLVTLLDLFVGAVALVGRTGLDQAVVAAR